MPCILGDIVTLIILSSGLPRPSSDRVREVSYGITNEITQPPQRWSGDVYDSLQHFFWLFPPSQGKRVIALSLVWWSAGSDGSDQDALDLGTSPVCPQEQSQGALEMRSAPAQALWRLAPEGTVGQQPEDLCFPSSHLKNHFCLYVETRNTHKNVPCSQQSKKVWLFFSSFFFCLLCVCGRGGQLLVANGLFPLLKLLLGWYVSVCATSQSVLHHRANSHSLQRIKEPRSSDCLIRVPREDLLLPGPQCPSASTQENKPSG